MNELIKLVSSMMREFIVKFPMLFLLGLIISLYAPLIPSLFQEKNLFDLEINLLVVKFAYAGIPLWLTCMWVGYLPIYYFYVMPNWDRIDEENRQALRDSVTRKPPS